MRRPANVCGLCPLDTRTGGILPSPLMGPYYNAAASRSTPVYVHRICALWAPEVYCDSVTSGALRNVVQAYRRGRHLRCSACNVAGATIGCQVTSCPKVFHFLCLQRGHCAFIQAQYSAWCSRHTHTMAEAADNGNLSADGPPDGDDEEDEEDEEDGEGDREDDGEVNASD